MDPSSRMYAANLVIAPQLLAALLGLLASLAIVVWGIPARLRLQDRPHPMARFLSHLRLIGLNLLLVLGGSWVFAVIFSADFSLDRPPLWVLVGPCLLVLACDDLWFYGIHRMMHQNKELYRRIHRVHHEAYAPLPLEYIYVHPLELLVGSFGMVLPLAAIFLWNGSMNVWTLAIVSSLRQLHELDIHSGVRGVLLRGVPLLAMADHHDRHHAKPNLGNYGSATLIWDRLFGTLSGE